MNNKLTHGTQARYALLKVGLPTERGNTPQSAECHFNHGVPRDPKIAWPIAYATFATLPIRHW